MTSLEGPVVAPLVRVDWESEISAEYGACCILVIRQTRR